jgi:predicted nuclease with TOPRIM domain
MRIELEERLRELRSEFESGQKMLAKLEVEKENLTQTILRISGAIQVLEELLEAADSTAPADSQSVAVLATETIKINEKQAD